MARSGDGLLFSKTLLTLRRRAGAGGGAEQAAACGCRGQGAHAADHRARRAASSTTLGGGALGACSKGERWLLWPGARDVIGPRALAGRCVVAGGCRASRAWARARDVVAGYAAVVPAVAGRSSGSATAKQRVSAAWTNRAGLFRLPYAHVPSYGIEAYTADVM